MVHDDPVLGAVGPRLRALRRLRGATLAGLSELTGISVSTLSRLESGGRKPTLELLLALARAYQVPLDELVGAPAPADPRIRARPVRRNGRTLIPLTRQPGGIRAYKMIVPAGEPEAVYRPLVRSLERQWPADLPEIDDRQREQVEMVGARIAGIILRAAADRHQQVARLARILCLSRCGNGESSAEC